MSNYFFVEYSFEAALRPSFMIKIKTTVNPIRIPKKLTSLSSAMIKRIQASMKNLKKLKKSSLPRGL